MLCVSSGIGDNSPENTEVRFSLTVVTPYEEDASAVGSGCLQSTNNLNAACSHSRINLLADILTSLTKYLEKNLEQTPNL